MSEQRSCLVPYCFCNVYFPLKFCKSHTAAYTVSQTLFQICLPITPTTHEPNLWYCTQRWRYVKNHKLVLFLLTRLTWTQNYFIILISRIRCIHKTLGLMPSKCFPQFHFKAKHIKKFHRLQK